MRIGFIEDTHLHGGTQIWVKETIIYYLGDGHDVSIITPKDSWVANHVKDTAAKVFTYDFDDIPFNGDKYEQAWIDGLKEMEVAITTVHPPRDNFHCVPYAGECLHKAKLETILIPKCGTVVPEYKKEFYYPREDINIMVIPITIFMQNYLLNEYRIPAENIHQIYQGTELKRFNPVDYYKPDCLKEYNIPKGAAPLIGCMGTFEDRKGQICLINALAEIKKHLKNVHLLLVGDGEDEKTYEKRIAELELTENVTIAPFTKHPQRFFRAIDILSLPSIRKEGLPNVLLEAMAMRVPVVASNLAGVMETVHDNETGFLLHPGDEQQIIDGILKMWNDQNLYKKMQANGYDLIHEHFDKHKQFKEFGNFFIKLTENE